MQTIPQAYLQNGQLILRLVDVTLCVIQAGKYLHLFGRLQEIIRPSIKVLHLRSTTVVSRPEGKVIVRANLKLWLRIADSFNVTMRRGVEEIHIVVLLVHYFNECIQITVVSFSVLILEIITKSHENVSSIAIIGVPLFTQFRKYFPLLVFVYQRNRIS